MGKNKDRLLTKSIPWADSILEQVINLPAAGGEDLQSTAEEQVLAVENLLKMVNRKVGEKNGIGEYVWKKQKIVEKVIINPIIQLCGYTPFKVKSSDVYLPLVTEEFFDGFALNNPSFPGYKFEYTDGVLYQYTAGSQKSVAKFDPVALTITNVNGVGGSYAASGEDFVYTGDKVCPTLSDEVEFLVSYDESAYPNKAALDGYWYEVFEEGIDFSKTEITKIAVDNFTLSASTSGVGGRKINHSLGEVPRAAVIIGAPTKNTNTVYNYFNVHTCVMINLSNKHGAQISIGYNYQGTEMRYALVSDSAWSNPSETQVQFYDTSSYTVLPGGVEFTLLTMV